MPAMTFGQALEQWLRGRGLSLAALARITGVKSATTVSRIVHDQSTPRRCEAFLRTLESAFPDMTEEERRLLRQGLTTSAAGLEDAHARSALAQLLLDDAPPPHPTPLSELLCAHTDADACDVYCIQCADKTVLDAFALLLDKGDQRIRIHHFLAPPLPGGMAAYAADAARMLCDPRYTVQYLQGELPAASVWRPGSMMLLRTRRNQSERQLLILPQPGGQVKTLPLEGVDMYRFMLEETRQAMGGAPLLNAPCFFNSPRNGLDYLSRCYERERGRACYLLRPRPNLAMVPVELLQGLYNDATALQQTSVKDYALELRRICYLRYANRVAQPGSTYVIFSPRGLRDFMRTGILLDHFRSLRPFTPAERRQILAHLIHQAETMPTMHLFVARDEQLFRRAVFSCYEGGGVLMSPAPNTFITTPAGGAPYCEAYFGDAAFARQFRDHYLQTLLPSFALPEADSLRALRELLDAAV